MATESDVITVFVKHDICSKILCIERHNLIDCVRRKFLIENDFYIEQFTKPKKEWCKVTSLTVANMATIRVIENCQSDIKSDGCSEHISSIVKKLTDGESLSEKDSCYAHAFLSEEPIPISSSSESQNSSSGKRRKLTDGIQTRASKSTQTKKAVPKVHLQSKSREASLLKEYRHIVVLKKEANKDEKDRDDELINNLLRQTFSERRDFIEKKGPKVMQIKQMYPILFEKKYLLAEFERIMESNCVLNFYDNLKVHCYSMISLAPGSVSARGVIKAMREKIELVGRVQAEIASYVDMAGALLVLPSLFHNRPNTIIQFQTSKPTWDFPIILCESPMSDALTGSPTFNIYAEGYFVYKTKDLIEAYVIYMSIFFMFDISYPDQCAQSLTFIETFLLGHPTAQDIGAVKKMRTTLLQMQ